MPACDSKLREGPLLPTFVNSDGEMTKEKEKHILITQI